MRIRGSRKLARCPIDDADARLAYVTISRARTCLDLDGLTWLNDHPDGTPVALVALVLARTEKVGTSVRAVAAFLSVSCGRQ
ncbi:hypothetical protein ACIF70_35455 [Actinacidiphila glaucinigra]|uniref:hypothetical protein n=1 Tax=Actinacidiphila glaucinigra TaxID=235986 RepID=UPI002DD99ED7|nr:hypothetical protein [Actinacidiphila glaucinigra]WSD57768.1 hypothetical protein OIE69_01950 [Actinacidiphila glaucinigra]